jgi:ATP-dependent helicase/DNAse subunit B
MLGVYRMSLAQLAASVAEPELAAANRTRLDALGAEALAYAVVREVLPQLTSLGTVAELPGFPRSLTRTLRDLRLARVRPLQLACDRDLALMLARWEGALDERRLADFASVCAIAADAFAGSRLAGHALVVIDIDAQTACERALLEAIQSVSPTVHVVDTGGRAQPQVSICSASSEALEAVEVARRIRGAAACGTAFDQMAILLRSPERQQAVIEEALERAGIPAWFALGARRPDPAGRALLALLTCALEGLPDERGVTVGKGSRTP